LGKLESWRAYKFSYVGNLTDEKSNLKLFENNISANALN